MCTIGGFVRLRRVPRARPITAYRSWEVTDRGTRLHSLYKHVARGWTKAAQRADAAPAPGLVDLHGFWAFKRRSDVRDDVGRSNRYVGIVHLWGVVAEHGFGYRAEYASIAALFEKADMRWLSPAVVAAVRRQARVLARGYRLRVVPFKGGQ